MVVMMLAMMFLTMARVRVRTRMNSHFVVREVFGSARSFLPSNQIPHFEARKEHQATLSSCITHKLIKKTHQLISVVKSTLTS